MKCKFCSKEIQNMGSLAVHEKYYCKLNANRKFKKSYFIEYNEKVKNKEIDKIYTNQFTKSKITNSIYIISDETKKKMSESSKNQIWTQERRDKHSVSMANAVKKYPESYSANNVCGRTKKLEYKGFSLTGKWEYDVAIYFDKNKIKWTNKIQPFDYIWKEKFRKYFPDFYLFEFDLFIEVKGYETDRDRAKWSVVPNIFIIKKESMRLVRKNEKLGFM